MSVVVAHQASNIGHLALQEAAKEANMRQTTMAVIHVAEGVDLDVIEAHKAGLSDEIAKVLAEVDLDSVDWTLQVTTGEDVAEANHHLDRRRARGGGERAGRKLTRRLREGSGASSRQILHAATPSGGP